MPSPTGVESPTGRVVVVSPHLDDGVLSLGAAIASWVRRGVRVELLTVFACDPESGANAGGWDGRAGYRSEGESAKARRDEDVRACAILGAHPVWLPFGTIDYERHGEADDVRGAIAAAVEGADTVFLPGAPLSHPDHAWLTRTLVPDLGRSPRLGFYAEQPYAARAERGRAAPPDWLDAALGTPLRFVCVPSRGRDRLAKWRAIRQYRSQLPLLGMRRTLRRGPYALVRHEEKIGWFGDPSGV